MPASLIAAVKARVGARGFSAYVSAAVGRHIQRDLLQEKEAEIDSTAPEIQEEAVEVFGARPWSRTSVPRRTSRAAGKSRWRLACPAG